MRAQPGTSSLRAILYMDEIFGYMPPTANPPSKMLFLTLLKQARAYGLGLVLATQNPVDLDYKGLSNTGTWFIGRLQTERDKMRVMEGLEGATAGGKFDKQGMERTLAGLGKRVFLLHNVHENEPVVFSTRWVMSYLPGPVYARSDQAPDEGSQGGACDSWRRRPSRRPPPPKRKKPVPIARRRRCRRRWISTSYRPSARPARARSWCIFPWWWRRRDVGYSSARYNLNDEKRFGLVCEIDDGPVPVDWDNARSWTLDFDQLETEPGRRCELFGVAGAGPQRKELCKVGEASEALVAQQQVAHAVQERDHSR